MLSPSLQLDIHLVSLSDILRALSLYSWCCFLGEIAAAFTAGHISAEDAIKIAYYRGQVIASNTAKGGMLAVGLGLQEASAFIEPYKDKVAVACYNSPNNLTLSGDADAIEEIKEHLEASNLFNRKLKTNGIAYHSPHMLSAASEYRELLESTKCCSNAMLWNSGRCRMLSTVSRNGGEKDMKGYDYWAANLERPVFFESAMRRMTEEFPDVNTIVEIGPHPALAGAIREVASPIQKPLSHLSTLKREQNDMDQILTLAGELWARGSKIDINTVTRPERSLGGGEIENVPGWLLTDLPTYRWNYAKKYISEPRQSREHRGCKHPRHDLLGRRLPGLSHTEPQWRNVLRLGDISWLKHHTVSVSFLTVIHQTNFPQLDNEVVFPAAGYLLMAIEAATQLNLDAIEPSQVRSYTLKSLLINTALIVPGDNDGIETLFALRPNRHEPTSTPKNISGRLYEFRVSSITARENICTEHASGIIGINVSQGGKYQPVL